MTPINLSKDEIDALTSALEDYLLGHGITMSDQDNPVLNKILERLRDSND